MNRICAWCGRELDQSEPGEHLQVTHGLCPVCRRRFFASAKAVDSPSIPEAGSDAPVRTGEHLPAD